MNKAERNSFGQSAQPKKLQAPAKRRELAKKLGFKLKTMKEGRDKGVRYLGK